MCVCVRERERRETDEEVEEEEEEEEEDEEFTQQNCHRPTNFSHHSLHIIHYHISAFV